VPAAHALEQKFATDIDFISDVSDAWAVGVHVTPDPATVQVAEGEAELLR
jgi:hypothetical protein